MTLSDMYQIQAGKIAETKGQSQGVKDFGTMMVTDHTAMSNQMKHLFAATNTKIPTELGARGKRMIDDLNAASPGGLRQALPCPAADLPGGGTHPAERLCRGRREQGHQARGRKAIPQVQAHLAKVHELQAEVK